MTGKIIPIPEKGLLKDDIISEMRELSGKDVNWHAGKAFGYVYHIDDEHSEFIKKAHNLFSSTNALSPLAFPSLKRFETEIVSMTAEMLGGDGDTVGNVTSCGTESILVAVQTYRNWGRSKKNIKEPEMILPKSAHPAFEKAAHYFDVKVVHTDLADDYRADVEALKEAITKNTVLIVGSACDYPRGVIDPIQDMAGIAEENKIGFHTDSCLGGFMLPWIKKLGYNIPPFDFRVPGVSSMSVDSHKYGFGFKGSSVVLFKTKKYQRSQYFAFTTWPGGVYVSPSLTGTRPGGVIAGTWAAMKSLGKEGYLKYAKITMDTTQKLMKGINSIPELHVLGEPAMTVFSFGSDKINMYVLADDMQKRGWVLDRLQFPRCLHCIVNPNQAEIADEFLDTLKSSVEFVKKNPKKDPEGTAGMYGLISKIQFSKLTKKIVKNKVKDFLAEQYRID
ncbi:MAG: aminotransferase class V-fold PLP-dependent enzyme [Promethearchaeota archaeon]